MPPLSLTGEATTFPAIRPGGFSSGDPLQVNPSIGASYSGVSDAFSGSLTTSSGDLSGFVIDDNASADRIQFRTSSGSGSGLVVWDTFLGGGSAISFESGSSLSINIATSAGSVVRRFVLRDTDGNYYASTSTGFNATGTTSFDPLTVSWFNFDPESDPTAIGASASIDFGTTSFSEVGFVVNLGDLAAAQAVRVDSFEVDATAIPEPAHFAAIAAALGLALVIRRRK